MIDGPQRRHVTDRKHEGRKPCVGDDTAAEEQSDDVDGEQYSAGYAAQSDGQEGAEQSGEQQAIQGIEDRGRCQRQCLETGHDQDKCQQEQAGEQEGEDPLPSSSLHQ